ncbi:hypothetical protein ACWGI0_11310 [Streptomyces sp. NPDC054802]
MVNWAQMYDCHGDVDRVPELLERVEREDAAEAWEELGHRLVLECDLVFPAGFAALPRLMRLASRSARAPGPAGTIVRCSAGGHGCDDLLAGCADAIAEFGQLLDRHLRTRPADYLATFLDLLAVEEAHYVTPTATGRRRSSSTGQSRLQGGVRGSGRAAAGRRSLWAGSKEPRPGSTRSRHPRIASAVSGAL